MAAAVRRSSVVRAYITVGPVWIDEDGNLQDQFILDTAVPGELWNYDLQAAVINSSGTVSFTLDSSQLFGAQIGFGFLFHIIDNTFTIGTVFELVVTATDSNGSATITILLKIVSAGGDGFYGGASGQARSRQSPPENLEQYFKDLRRSQDESRNNMGIRNRGSGMGIR